MYIYIDHFLYLNYFEDDVEFEHCVHTERDRSEESGKDGENSDRVKATKV